MGKQTRSAGKMVEMFVDDKELLEKLQKNPVPVLRETAAVAEAAIPPVYTRDKSLYRIAVGVLGLLALCAAGGSIILVLKGKTTPEVLVALGSAAVGSLVGLFAPPPAGK